MTPASKALCATAMLGLAACAQSQADTMGGSVSAMPAMASETVMVGGNEMFPTKTIVDNAVNSDEHTTLVAAVKAAGLVETLMGPGPFTVFAPTDAAFGKLPPGTVESLLEPENREALTAVLTYHVVPDRLDMADLKQRIEAGGGEATLTTVNGGTLTAMMNGPTNIVIRDDTGGVADISTYDVRQSNGVIHVVESVLLPG